MPIRNESYVDDYSDFKVTVDKGVVKVESDSGGKVKITIDGKTKVVVGDHLIMAIKNCMNVGR